MKTLTLLIFLVITSQFVHKADAQCTPDNYTNPGIYPDTTKGLDTAFANKPYSMIMTAVIPKDTFVFNTKMPIDSIGILKFEGLPEGFTVETNTESGFWIGGTSGCVQITGNPVDSQTGVYPLNIEVLAVVSGLPAPYPIPGFKIVIIGKSFIIEKSEDEIFFVQNPIKGIAKISINSKNSCKGQLELLDLSGKVLINRHINTEVGINTYTLQVDKFTSGLYLIKLVQPDQTQLRKLIIEQ